MNISRRTMLQVPVALAAAPDPAPAQFLAACPSSTGDVLFPAVILRRQGQSLREVEYLDYGTSWVVASSSLGCIAHANHDMRRLKLVSGKRPNAPATVLIPQGWGTPVQANFLKLPNGEAWFCVGTFGDTKQLRMSGVSLKAMTSDTAALEPIDPQQMRYAESNGQPLTPGEPAREVWFARVKDGNLHALMPGLPTVGLPFRSPFADDGKLAIALRCRNESGLVVTKRPYRQVGTGADLSAEQEVHVQNKRTGQWSMPPFAPGTVHFRIFGPWVTGIVGRSENRVSPGKAARRPRRTSSGFAFDEIVNHFYYPGTLAFYHVERGLYFSHHTGQGDSEVIWISGQNAILRISDQLISYVIDGARLTHRELLMKHELVPDIHWALPE